MATALLAACSGNLREVTNQPPQAALDGLIRAEDGLIVELALRNVNDEPLRLEAVGIELTLDGQPLADGSEARALTISSRGREVLRFSLTPLPAGLQRLEALGEARVERLPWRLEARLSLAGSRQRDTKADGWLHRVPGQPNRFR